MQTHYSCQPCFTCRSVTVANLHPQYMTLAAYSLRVSCYAPGQLPCPTAAPQYGECSSNIQLVLGKIMTRQQAQLQGTDMGPVAGECRRRIQGQVRVRGA